MPGSKPILDRFYSALQRRDGATMATFYHPDGTFSDPVFPSLTGAGAGTMWTMLCGRSKDMEVQYECVQSGEGGGIVRWVARYTFTVTGRPVENRVTAHIELRDGKIARHVDDFDFWRWSRQALGPKGLLLGWTPLVKGAVRATARKNLEDYAQAHALPL